MSPGMSKGISKAGLQKFDILVRGGPNDLVVKPRA